MDAAAPTAPSRPEEPVPVFERPPIITGFLDATEEALRSRVARISVLRRVLLLERDWMTRITALMIFLAVLWGGIGGFDAFGTRTQTAAWALGQSLHLTNQEVYSAITLHGVRMLFGFAQQFQMAVFGLLAINAMGVVARYKWGLYLSVALVNVSLVLMQGPIYALPFNDNYFPAVGWYYLAPLGIAGQSSYVAAPLWYLGWLVLCAGTMLWAAWVLAHAWRWLKERPAGAAARRLPAFLLFILADAVLVLLSYGALAISTVWDIGSYAYGWALDALANQFVFWLFGHGIVYILFLIPVAGFYLLVPILARRPIYSYRAAFLAAALFVILTPILSIHHLYLAPFPSWSVWLTMVLTFAIVVPSAITFFSVWMTVKGVPRSEWEWNTVALFLLLSFGGSIAGGLTGPVNATVSWDVDLHNTLFIVSHFHAITVLSITAGAFALAYALVPILIGRYWYSPWLSRLHFALTAVGGIGLVFAFDELGQVGLLRRTLLFPRLPAIDLYELLLTGFTVVILLGQLPFVLNALLTIYRGRPVAAEGRSFDEIVRLAAQSTMPRPRAPVDDVARPRRIPRVVRERAEVQWVATVVVLLVAVVVVSTPGALSTANGVSGGSTPLAGTVFVDLVGHQYYWSVAESGPLGGSYDNVVVVRAGEWISVNATAEGATQSLYIPFRDAPVVDVQVVPGSTSHALFQAPTTPGVYGVPDGEYDGPWFGQDVAALVVLPASGAPMPSLDAFSGADGMGDVYDPPVMTAASASLVADDEGLFNDSVPGPTLSTSAGPVSFSWRLPLSTIGLDNYLVNVTSNAADAQTAWVEAHGMALPYTFGVYRIDPSAGPVAVETGPMPVDTTTDETVTLAAGAYLYGLVTPVAYEYDPDGESNGQTGLQEGSVMGLWGVLWVAGP